MTTSMSRSAVEHSTIRKITFRFIPVIILAYFVAYIDRVNIGMIKQAMSADIGLTDVAFGLASGLIFIGLIFFEIPSNKLAHKVGPRRWIARIMASWGVVVMAGALIQIPEHLYVMRVVLGLAEAGMAPAVFLFLAQWFPRQYRARALSAFYLSVPIAMAFGSPLTGWILEVTHNLVGIDGWRWVFLVEGFAAIIVAPVVLRLLSDHPSKAKWLTAEEQSWLTNTLEEEGRGVPASAPHSFRGSLVDGKVWIFAVTYLFLGFGANALVYWMPTIVGSATRGLGPLQIGLVSAIPFVCAAFGIYLTGRIAERTQAKRWNILSPVLVSVAGFAAVLVFDGNITMQMAMISLALAGALASQPQFWTLPTSYLSGAAAAGGIALINSVNNIGGFLGPYSFGWLKEIGGNSTMLPFIVIAAAQVLAAAGVLIAYRTKSRRSDLSRERSAAEAEVLAADATVNAK
ncbi:MFS transporter [Paenarthrobacter nitroguajacolicus]|uniref:MFS transporter n=1 Tax=Paenarthrobacter nitroguajacolicus TaxID=211146 RepID=UPI00248BED88|nr:MFS transporter [Paenarthrobacter nitroguajacolicus]MDI2037291.1 putative tartrate transporter [Paenarthrobacter nitroguajacolicus]